MKQCDVVHSESAKRGNSNRHPGDRSLFPVRHWAFPKPNRMFCGNISQSNVDPWDFFCGDRYWLQQYQYLTEWEKRFLSIGWYFEWVLRGLVSSQLARQHIRTMHLLRKTNLLNCSQCECNNVSSLLHFLGFFMYKRVFVCVCVFAHSSVCPLSGGESV